MSVTSIRGLDQELYQKAKIAAIKAGIKTYEWINLALKEKLEGSKNSCKKG